MKKIINTLLSCIIFFITISIAYATTDIIPRKVLFGNPDKTNASISRDGNKIAFIAPANGVLNIWVADSKNLTQAKPVTHEQKRPIMGYFWSFNSNYLLYVQDKNGDENFHLYRIDLKSNKIKDLTPFPKVRAGVINLSQNFPNEMLIGLNKNDPKWHDTYLLNIISGKLTLVEKNRQFSGFIADENFKLRIATRPNAENSPEFYIKNPKGKWEFYEKVPFEDALSVGFISFNKKGTVVYKLDSQNRDKAAFYSVDLLTKKKTILAESSKADCQGLLVHPTELTPQAFSSEYEKIEWTVMDDRIKKDFTYLKNAQPENFAIVSRSLADDKWIVQYYSDIKPSSYYLYERDPKTNKPLSLTFLFTTKPLLEKQQLAPMKPIVIKARDGLDLVCYLTLPLAAQKPTPMVLLVHGGPWGRDSWGLDVYHQWLANRGYGVLSVNYRGSTGFGKAFINAGNNEWAGKMHDDLIDAVKWAVKQKIANPQKIAIMGGSYGGYATLVGLTFTPDIFCCGVSIVGPSNLFTLLKTIPPYWEPEIALFKKRVGDIDTAAGRKMLMERSPLTYADRIKKPLLILQGEHDPRVKKAEAEQIVGKMKEKSIPVTYVLYHDEGHGFIREPNSMSSNAIIEQFLAANLGGRFEPIKDDFKGANFSILEGKDNTLNIKK